MRAIFIIYFVSCVLASSNKWPMIIVMPTKTNGFVESLGHLDSSLDFKTGIVSSSTKNILPSLSGIPSKFMPKHPTSTDLPTVQKSLIESIRDLKPELVVLYGYDTSDQERLMSMIETARNTWADSVKVEEMMVVIVLDPKQRPSLQHVLETASFIRSTNLVAKLFTSFKLHPNSPETTLQLLTGKPKMRPMELYNKDHTFMANIMLQCNTDPIYEEFGLPDPTDHTSIIYKRYQEIVKAGKNYVSTFRLTSTENVEVSSFTTLREMSLKNKDVIVFPPKNVPLKSVVTMQGYYNDCPIVGSMLAFMMNGHEQMLKGRIEPNDKLSDTGAYFVKMAINGIEQAKIVDDRVPKSTDGFVHADSFAKVLMTRDQRALEEPRTITMAYPILIEKFVAETFSSYDSLEQGFSIIYALQMLAGCSINDMKIFSLRPNTDDQFMQSKYQENLDSLWSNLILLSKAHAPMLAATPDLKADASDIEKLEFEAMKKVVIPQHTYVLNTTLALTLDGKELKLIKFFNPHGSHIEEGERDFGPMDPMWFKQRSRPIEKILGSPARLKYEFSIGMFFLQITELPKFFDFIVGIEPKVSNCKKKNYDFYVI